MNQITKKSSIIVLTLKDADMNPPYILENNTRYCLKILQLPNEYIQYHHNIIYLFK